MSRDLFRPVNPACANIPPDVFFPIPIGAGKDSGADERWEYPRTICNGCPDRVACLEFALEHREREGMWGSATPGWNDGRSSPPAAVTAS